MAPMRLATGHKTLERERIPGRAAMVSVIVLNTAAIATPVDQHSRIIPGNLISYRPQLADVT